MAHVDFHALSLYVGPTLLILSHWPEMMGHEVVEGHQWLGRNKQVLFYLLLVEAAGVTWFMQPNTEELFSSRVTHLSWMALCPGQSSGVYLITDNVGFFV